MASFQGWTETIILSLAFVLMLAFVIGEMNSDYGQSNSLVGLDTTGLQNSIDSYSATMSSQIHGGQVNFLTLTGLTLYSSWNMILSVMDISFQLISGGWLRNLAVDYIGLPASIGVLLQAIFIMSLGYLILKILLRVKV